MRYGARKRTGTGTRLRFLPGQVDAALTGLFVATESERDTLRTRTVGAAVAATLGVAWSPTLATLVREALCRMGGRLITFEHRHLVCRIRPRHFDDDDALAVAVELRRLKRVGGTGA